jgi:mannitol-specific phosphotransferase system IIBC component
MHPNDHTTAIGTTGGTVLTVLFNIHSEDIVQTIFLAIVGAIVSFFVSLILKSIVKAFKNRG